jgi:putative N6-adenine-specific DNA methylase
MSLSLFAVTAPGIEAIAAAELRALGVAKPDPTPGGVAFEGTPEDLYRANLELRTAGRVLVRIAGFRAAGFDPLRKRAARLPWERWLAPGDALALRVTCRKSRLYHSGAVAQRVAEAIAERLGFEPARAAAASDDADEAAAPAGARVQLVLVRIERDLCTLSVDASGEPLHKRGYRQATGKAPLRETLAAAVLLASGWDARQPLLDPFCGSGTLAIEAALLARRRAPGAARRFAFEAWPGFDPALWARLRAEAAARSAAAPAPPPILASDRDAGAVAAARANAQRAGVADDVALAQRAVSKLEAPAGPGFVVTNPPHGVRLARGGDLRDLYARFGAVLRARCPGWTAALLSSHARLQAATGLALEPRLHFLSGGLRLALVTGRVPEAG